ncbi:MAG TPA: hypothetical protein VGK73_22720 [Polyangiaceae bacterium]
MYLANLAFVSALGATAPALAPPASHPQAAPGDVATLDQPVAAEEALARDTRRGTLFHPSRPPLGRFRLGVGGLFDAIDPQAIYGFELRFPHLTIDSRYGLGNGFSLTGHLDTILVINEVTVGGGWAQYYGPWSIEVGLEAGLFVGTLNEFGFDSTYLAPMYVPRVVAGHSWKDIAISLSLDSMFTFTQTVRVGEITENVGGGNSFLGARAMFMVENTLPRGGVWYYGVGAMLTRSYYQVWILLPDSPELLGYARVLAGYEF